MELMDEAYKLHIDPFLAFLLDKLLLVWAMPRSDVWISTDNVVKLLSDQNHATDYLESMKKELVLDFTAALGRAKPRVRNQPVHDFVLFRCETKKCRYVFPTGAADVGPGPRRRSS